MIRFCVSPNAFKSSFSLAISCSTVIGGGASFCFLRQLRGGLLAVARHLAEQRDQTVENIDLPLLQRGQPGRQRVGSPCAAQLRHLAHAPGPFRRAPAAATARDRFFPRRACPLPPAPIRPCPAPAFARRDITSRCCGTSFAASASERCSARLSVCPFACVCCTMVFRSSSNSFSSTSPCGTAMSSRPATRTMMGREVVFCPRGAEIGGLRGEQKSRAGRENGGIESDGVSFRRGLLVAGRPDVSRQLYNTVVVCPRAKSRSPDEFQWMRIYHRTCRASTECIPGALPKTPANNPINQCTICPPISGSESTSTTDRPSRADSIAAEHPAIPAPTTQTSASDLVHGTRITAASPRPAVSSVSSCGMSGTLNACASRVTRKRIVY